RYIRQSFHELESQINPENEYIIIARKPAANMDFHEVKKSLIHVLKVGRVLKQKPNNSK
ncbi:TPA: ribonuclease P protein component, partial [Listeria monocytogenes]|nr:ribonuclease P protein component [Listeria monocytogenes]HAK1313419.1 ribonuclease P protein component [Listeria monocytogenes]